MVRLLLTLLLLGLVGCMTPVTRRMDELNRQLIITQRQLELLGQKMDEGTIQVSILNQQFEKANQRFENVEGMLNRSPLFAPLPAKPKADASKSP